MKEIIYLKKFSHLLKINKNKIVDYWFDMQEVKDIFLTTQLSNEEKRIFYDFFDCIVNVLKWELSMSDCPIENDFLKLLNKNSLNIINLFTLLSSLKASLFRFFYKEELLSFALQRDIEKNFLLIKNELYIDYEHLLSQKCNIKAKHSNLLSEYKKAVDLSNIVSKTNPKGLITYANDKFCEISGYKREELIGKAHNLIRHPSMPSSVFKELWDTIKNKKTWQGLITNLRKDGRSYVVHSTIVPILDIDGDIVEFIAIRNDVTEFENTKEQLGTLNKAMKHKVDELYSMAQNLEQQASIDILTGIFNRMKFEEYFDLEVQKAKMHRNPLSIILLDIDDFKKVNDTFGHNEGDEVIKSISNLLTKNVRGTDTLSRWGGEEFVILLPSTSLEQAKIVANNLRKIIFDHDFNIPQQKISCSFGVAIYNPEDTKEELFKRVDKILYKAKNSGKNIVFGEDELDDLTIN